MGIKYSYDEIHTKYYYSDWEDDEYTEDPEYDLGFEIEPEPTAKEINRLANIFETDPAEDEYFNDDAYFNHH